MTLIKSLSVGHGDMFYIRHNSDSFTMIDCHMNDWDREEIVAELKAQSADKGITRFISTHPDEDHIKGLAYLDERMNLRNFYCVKNGATKLVPSESFKHYCSMRDGERSYYVSKGASRKWLNQGDDVRGGAGISFLWPNTANTFYQAALADAAAGKEFNNISLVARYTIGTGAASFLWIGDLETDFMENIVDDIHLEKTTIVFAPHHGRHTGKIPNSWLKKLDPQIIVIGEAPSRHLNYYTNYRTITQNKAWHITFDCQGEHVHLFASNPDYGKRFDVFSNLSRTMAGTHYMGSIKVETEYTL